MSTAVTFAPAQQLMLFTLESARRGGCVDVGCKQGHPHADVAPPPGARAKCPIYCPKCGDPVVAGIDSHDPHWLFLACVDCGLSLAVVPLVPPDVAADLAAISPPTATHTGAPGQAPS